MQNFKIFWTIQMHNQRFVMILRLANPEMFGYIKELIKRKLSSGLFWVVGAAEKKKTYEKIIIN